MRELLENFFSSRLNKTIVVIVALMIFMYVYSHIIGDAGAFMMFYIYISVLMVLVGIKLWNKYKDLKEKAEIIEQIPMSKKDYKDVHKNTSAVVKNYRFMAVVLWIMAFILISILLPSFIQF